MSDIFREVEEEVRKERLQQLWKRYGAIAVGAVVALVLAVAGYQGWTYYEQQQRELASDRYAAAVARLDGDTPEAALAALQEVADPAGSGYRLLAAFEQANLLAQQGDLDAAREIWLRIAGGSAPAAMRHVATLLSVQHDLDQRDPAELRARLEPVAADASAFRPLALELMAVIELRAGDAARAREHLQAAIDAPEAPSGLRQRASQILATLPE